MATVSKNVEEKKVVPVKKETHAVKKESPGYEMTPFDEMERRLENLFESFFPRGWLRSPFRWDMPSRGGLSVPFEDKLPRVDVIDRDNDILVRAELPGVDKKDLDVTLSDNTVTIKSSISHEEKKEEGNYFRQEISKGSFCRTLGLPSDVDTSDPKAVFRDGVLEITLNKVEKAKRRSVKIE